MGKVGRHTYSLSDLINVDVGSFVSVAGGVRFHSPDNHGCIRHPKYVSCFPFTAKMSTGDFEDVPKSTMETLIEVGNDVWIGEHASILSGVKIGDGAIIAAHAVVPKNVPPYALVAGNPAEVKRYRFSPWYIEQLLKIKWWDWTDDVIKERIEDFKDIDVFIRKYAVAD